MPVVTESHVQLMSCLNGLPPRCLLVSGRKCQGSIRLHKLRGRFSEEEKICISSQSTFRTCVTLLPQGLTELLLSYSGDKAMTPLRRLRPIILLLITALITFTIASSLSALAQSDKQEEKKDDKDKKKEEELPLKPEGKVTFTTDEGTWMSLDVSPDGQMIVFDLLGDIYTMPATGGEAKRIVGGMSFESQPKFSPDGKLIAFISDRSGAEQLWVCKPDGTDVKPITKGRGAGMLAFLSPSWTPDGNYIIASKSERGIGTFHVYLWHKDGGSGVSLGPPPP